eukprot:scaffold298_cov247-Pinguiococcus_pyrenoidosus.AAC.37
MARQFRANFTTARSRLLGLATALLGGDASSLYMPSWFRRQDEVLAACATADMKGSELRILIFAQYRDFIGGTDAEIYKFLCLFERAGGVPPEGSGRSFVSKLEFKRERLQRVD